MAMEYVIPRPQPYQQMVWDGANFAELEEYLPDGYGTTLTNNNDGTVTVTNAGRSKSGVMHIGDSFNFLADIIPASSFSVVPEPTVPIHYVIAED
jgi:hypothetical protein